MVPIVVLLIGAIDHFHSSGQKRKQLSLSLLEPRHLLHGDRVYIDALVLLSALTLSLMPGLISSLGIALGPLIIFVHG